MWRAALLFAGVLVVAATATAAQPHVERRGGNIFLFAADGAEKQLTSTGRDSTPALAPDGRWVVFVRRIDGAPISTGSSDETGPAELWQIRSDGKEPTLLARTRESEKMENLIAAFENPRFSPDGRFVYFITPAWTTSGAVHVVDTTKAKERFLMPGNALEVVRSGEYAGCLLVQQHRYFIGGGSYDWFWLFRPDGKEVGPVGEETSHFTDDAPASNGAPEER